MANLASFRGVFMIFEQFLTLDYISTFLGTVIVTMLMVQFFKELPYIKKIPTKYFTFIVALFNIVICSILTNSFAFKNLYLVFINAILVTFTSTGGYDFTVGNVKFNKEIQAENSKDIIEKTKSLKEVSSTESTESKK